MQRARARPARFAQEPTRAEGEGKTNKKPKPHKNTKKKKMGRKKPHCAKPQMNDTPDIAPAPSPHLHKEPSSPHRATPEERGRPELRQPPPHRPFIPAAVSRGDGSPAAAAAAAPPPLLPALPPRAGRPLARKGSMTWQICADPRRFGR